MMYWNGNMGVWGYALMAASFLLFWGVIITSIVLFARFMGSSSRRYVGGLPGVGGAEDVLAERFARGEIDDSEYTARLTALRRSRGA